MNRSANFGLITFFFCLLLFNSCKSKKRIQLGKVEFQEAALLEHIKKNQIHFEWYASKANIKFDSYNQTFSGKLYLRMENSKKIWMVGKKLGIEGVRTLITPDSIFAINRLERTYFKKSLSEIKSEFGISLSFEQIQQILTSSIHIEPENVQKIEEGQDEYMLTAAIKDFLIKFWIDPHTGLVTKSKVSDHRNRTITMDYFDHQYVNNEQSAPYQINYEIPQTDFGKINFDMKISELTLDVPQNMPFSIPTHYTRID